MANRPNLSRAELQAAFAGDLARSYPVIMSVEQLASLLGVPKKTIYQWISLGRLDGAFRKRGKRHLIWRDRALAKILDGPTWES